LDNDLKNQGFEVTKSGRGNWQCGWRFVELRLEKEDCQCTVMKKYWDFEVVQDSSKTITEQIICNQKMAVNFKLDK
jgi:hypothetical protein